MIFFYACVCERYLRLRGESLCFIPFVEGFKKFPSDCLLLSGNDVGRRETFSVRLSEPIFNRFEFALNNVFTLSKCWFCFKYSSVNMYIIKKITKMSKNQLVMCGPTEAIITPHVISLIIGKWLGWWCIFQIFQKKLRLTIKLIYMTQYEFSTRKRDLTLDFVLSWQIFFLFLFAISY